jgi:hypothetical protein
MDYQELLPFLGLSIESQEVRDLILKYDTKYPSSTTCTGNSFGLKSVLEKNTLVLYFGPGFNCSFTKPILAKRKGSYIQQVTALGFFKNYKGELPFELNVRMSNKELTKILGEPHLDNFVFETITWRKQINDKMEIIVVQIDGKNEFNINFLYNPDLNIMEDYNPK